jgi:Domain of unknown function (DUF4399)
MRTAFFIAVFAVAALFTTPFLGTGAEAGETPAAKNAYCYIGWPNDGEVIKTRRFRVWFGLRNAGIAPAGVQKPNTGHHHLIIDAPLPPFDQEIPADKNHLHFGAGQTEAIIELAPGKHTLQLLMGDYQHIPHNPPIYSRQITIYVK